jgi:hypothetical protein
MEGFLRLMRTPLGYDPHNVMSVGIPVHDGTYKTWAARSAYFDQLLKKVAAVPGVTTVGISSNARRPRTVANRGRVLASRRRKTKRYGSNFVNPGYFSVLRIPMAQGRIWNETENHNAAQ